MFKLAEEIDPTESESLFDRIKRLSGTINVGRLRPNSKRASLMRACFVQLSDDVELGQYLPDLQALPGVERVSISSQRKLI